MRDMELTSPVTRVAAGALLDLGRAGAGALLPCSCLSSLPELTCLSLPTPGPPQSGAQETALAGIAPFIKIKTKTTGGSLLGHRGQAS